MNINKYIIKGFDFSEFKKKKDKLISLEYTSTIEYDVLALCKDEVITLKKVRDNVSFIESSGVATIEISSSGKPLQIQKITSESFDQMKKQPVTFRTYMFTLDYIWGSESDEQELVSVMVTQINEDISLLTFWDDWYLEVNDLLKIIEEEFSVESEKNSVGHSLLSAWTALREKK